MTRKRAVANLYHKPLQTREPRDRETLRDYTRVVSSKAVSGPPGPLLVVWAVIARDGQRVVGAAGVSYGPFRGTVDRGNLSFQGSKVRNATSSSRDSAAVLF